MLRFVLSIEPAAEMDPVVIVAPYSQVVLILFLIFAPMDNVFELFLSAPIRIAALLGLIVVQMALVLQPVPQPLLVLLDFLSVLMVLVAQLARQLCKRMVAAPTRPDVLMDSVVNARRL
jgi:hypothetical protein